MGNTCCIKKIPTYKNFNDCDDFSSIKAKVNYNLYRIQYKLDDQNGSNLIMKKHHIRNNPILSHYFIHLEMLLLKISIYIEDLIIDFKRIKHSYHIVNERMKNILIKLIKILNDIFETEDSQDDDKLFFLEKDFVTSSVLKNNFSN